MMGPMTGTADALGGNGKNRHSVEFEGLLERNYSRAYSAAYRMMGNASDAEDLTQEAFVRVWAAFDRYDRSRPFEGWLFRIISNLAIDRWRRAGNTSVCSLDADASGAWNSTPRGGSYATRGRGEGRGRSSALLPRRRANQRHAGTGVSSFGNTPPGAPRPVRPPDRLSQSGLTCRRAGL